MRGPTAFCARFAWLFLPAVCCPSPPSHREATLACLRAPLDLPLQARGRSLLCLPFISTSTG